MEVVIITKTGVGPAYIGGRDTDKEGTQVEICKYFVMSPQDLKIYCNRVTKLTAIALTLIHCMFGTYAIKTSSCVDNFTE